MIIGHVFLVLGMLSHFLLDFRHCTFYVVECWNFCVFVFLSGFDGFGVFNRQAVSLAYPRYPFKTRL